MRHQSRRSVGLLTLSGPATAALALDLRGLRGAALSAGRGAVRGDGRGASDAGTEIGGRLAASCASSGGAPETLRRVAIGDGAKWI